MLTQFDWRAPNQLVAPMDPSIAAFTGAFGGWVAAHALAAATRFVADDTADPLSMSIDFLRGIGPGEVVSSASLTHASRSLRFVRVSTAHDGTAAAESSVVLARRRPTDSLAPVPYPSCAAPDSLLPAETRGLPVTWINHFDLRFATGKLGERAADLRSLVWVRLREPQPLDFVQLIAIADTPLPRIFLHYGAASKISTVSLSMQFHANRADLAALGTDFVLTESWCTAARHGYFDQQTRLWARSGQLLGVSSQVVWFNVGGEVPA